MSGIDYSQPISAIVKESTKKAHETVEHSPSAIALAKGQIPKDEYVRFLMILYDVYDAFERALDRHASHPVLEPTYNPSLLGRSAALEADISYLLSVPTNKWKSHVSYKVLQSDKPPALKRYVDRINTISDSSDPSPLLAHSYVRYLGDLSGGQSIKRALSKAYNLKDGQGGLEFFKFREMGSGKTGKEASIGELKKIKEWFRAGMDKGAGDDVKVKSIVVAEASLVFDLNKGIFDSIPVPSPSAAVTTTKDFNDVKEPKVVFDASKKDEGAYSVASVATVILAVGLAHFMLTVGGYTGERGEEKLRGIFDWIGYVQQLLFPGFMPADA